jgi:hypothetical protein
MTLPYRSTGECNARAPQFTLDIDKNGPCAGTKHAADDAAGHKAIHHYQDFLDHNELELACDMLELYAEDHRISREFWLALRDAPVKMELPRATRYQADAKSTIG